MDRWSKRQADWPPQPRSQFTLQRWDRQVMVRRIFNHCGLRDRNADSDADWRGQAERDHVRDEGQQPRVVGGELEADAEGDHKFVTRDGWKSVNFFFSRQPQPKYILYKDGSVDIFVVLKLFSWMTI